MATERTGPAVVFVPGFMQPAEAWRPVADLVGERYPSVLLRHRSHDLEGRLTEIATAGSDSVLCGYSLGGRLCLHAVARGPARYAGVVTVGASAGLDSPALRAARAEADEKLAAWMETQPIEEVVAVWERQPLFADQSDALVEEQRPGRLAQNPRDLALLLRTAGQGALDPVWHRLEAAGLPALALSGDRDHRYTEAARRLARSFPNGGSEVIEAAGHAAHLQQPRAVAERLVAFVDQHFGQSGV